MNKICAGCETEKPISEFYKQSRNSDGHYSKCKSCTIKYQRNREKKLTREISLRWYYRNREKAIATRKVYKANNAEKTFAHHVVERAIEKGDLIRSPCVICGYDQTHGHHDNYEKPLDVVWLCPQHHSERHQSLGR